MLPFSSPAFSDPNEVHVWIFPTDISTDECAGFRQILSQDELQRVDRFVFESDRIRFLASHGVMRLRLAAYCGVQPADLVFGEEAHGKPVLRSPSMPIQFNLSHAGSRAALAVTANLRCGVDIERIRSKVSDEAIARRFFCAREIEWLQSLAEPERSRGFFRLWALKEAILKADGKGLSLSLAAIDTTDVITGTSPHVAVPGPAGKTLTLWAGELNAAEGYTSAVAVEAESPSVRLC